MHEKSVMDNLMKKILQVAEQEKAKKIIKVSVKLGAFSHMSKQHFKQHFELASKGTIAEGAEIDAEVSEDIHDPGANIVTLKSIDISDEDK